MRLKFLIIAMFFLTGAHAQNVAINNDASLPDNSAILDIKSGTKGLLIPRMNTAAIAAIVNPAKGLLVLDTAKNQLLVNMGTPALPNWQTIVASSGWSLSGNAGTDPDSQFVGTLDTKPFIIRVNNVRSGFIDTLSENTSFGFRTLDSITIGAYNTAIGYKSLSANKSGFYNTGVGWGALKTNSSGHYNTAFGYGSVYSNSSGWENTGIGNLAIAFNTTGGRNTAIGNEALEYNTTGSANVALGSRTLVLNTTGKSNSAFGTGSLHGNTIGNNNTAMGQNALYLNQTGYSNVAIGTYALYNSGNRSNLVAVGDSALFHNGVGAVDDLGGTFNTALGSKTLFENTTGYSNTATGAYALLNNTTGLQNTANGSGALINNGIGIGNTAIGQGVMGQNISGNDNTAVGNFGLSANTIGIRNTSVGASSLITNIEGNNNTAIGYRADVSANNLFNSTAIGANAKVASSNSLVLGGTGAAGVNVGIGTTTPIARLHVVDSNVLFIGPPTIPGTTTYSPPASGIGSRMMWYPQKAAFRVGAVSGTEWDKDNIGNYSFASGYSSKASGFASTAMGQSTASGSNSIAMGNAAIASGIESNAIGTQTNASGLGSTAIGYQTIASGDYSIAMGNLTTASRESSTAMGYQTTASGYFSTSMGSQTIAKAYNALSIGNYNDNTDAPSYFIPANSDRIFQIGNGSSASARSNAVTVLRNGNVGLAGVIAPSRPLSFPASLGEKILLYPGGAGEVGIGVYGNELRLHADNPGAKVSLGTQDLFGVFTENAKAERNGVYAFSIFGSLWVNGTTYASDERFKQNIKPISSPLQKLLQLKGVEYEMKVNEFSKNHFTPERQIGLIAQNVEKIIPEAVNEMDGYKGVDYAKLVPLLIEGIKEQQKQFETSSEEVKQLKLQVAELKKLVEQLIKK